MSRTDYAKDSDLIAEHLGENVIAHEGATDATLIATMLDAHRRAVLALVEQQKVANRILLASFPSGIDGLPGRTGSSMIFHLGDGGPYLDDEIAAALGLDRGSKPPIAPPITHTEPCPWVARDDGDLIAIQWTDGDHVLYCASHEQARDVIDAVAKVMGWAVSDAS